MSFIEDQIDQHIQQRSGETLLDKMTSCFPPEFLEEVRTTSIEGLTSTERSIKFIYTRPDGFPFRIWIEQLEGVFSVMGTTNSGQSYKVNQIRCQASELYPTVLQVLASCRKFTSY